MNNIFDSLKTNLVVSSILEDAKRKDGSISSHSLKIQANKAYVYAMNEENLTPSKLQNFCRNLIGKTFEELTNEDGLTFDVFGKDRTIEDMQNDPKLATYFKKAKAWVKLQSLEVLSSDILFSHLFTFGKEKELKNKDGDKKYFSLNLFFTCLERYKASELAKKSDAEKLAENNAKTEEVSIVIKETIKEVENTSNAVSANKRRNDAKKAA